MALPDLNLLITLDVLLSEGSVAGAARRLRLSPSAMSRALARLREVTGDPLLVRAGRGLVPTPRAAELRERVGPLVQDTLAMLRPAAKPNLARLVRTFTIRVSEGFKDSGPLREGVVDLDTGVVGEATGPELRETALFGDRLIGVVREGHPLGEGEITPSRYASGRHISVSRRGLERGAIDDALKPLGLDRRIATIVGGFSSALAVARASDLIASVPERHTLALRAGLHSFALPVPTPELTISMLWHPRLDADPAHRWLRQCVREVCSTERGASSEAGTPTG